MTRTKARLGLALFAAAGLACWSGSVFAQWAWKDESGHLVFSDRGPPPSVKPSDILRQPGVASAIISSPTYNEPAKADPKPVTATKPPAGAPPKSLAERDLEAKKLDKDRADRERKADEDRSAQTQKTQECERAKGYQRALNEGQRIANTDAAGNREFLDDEKRAAEGERIRKIIEQTCS